MSEQVKRYDLGENLCTVSGDPLPKGVVAEEDYDALHAEAEAIKIASKILRNTEEHQRGQIAEMGHEIRQLKAEAEALRAENGRLQSACDHNKTCAQTANDLADQLSTELEAAQGLLRDMRHAATINPSCQFGMVNPCRCMFCVETRVNAFLTATPAPEVRQFDKPALLKDCKVTYSNSSRPLAEQGDRQEAQVMGRVHHNPDHPEPVRAVLNSIGRQLPDNAPLYTTPQPGPDVRALVEALEWIARVNACDYEYPEMARKALAKYRQAQQGEQP